MQLGQGEVRGEFPAAEVDGLPVGVGVAGEGDGVPGDLPGGAFAEPGPDQHPVGAQPGEEVVQILRARGGGAHPATQHHPRRFPPAARRIQRRKRRAGSRFASSCASRPGVGWAAAVPTAGDVATRPYLASM